MIRINKNDDKALDNSKEKSVQTDKRKEVRIIVYDSIFIILTHLYCYNFIPEYDN